MSFIIDYDDNSISLFSFSTIQLKFNGCIFYNKKILFAVQIDYFKKNIKVESVLSF